MISVQQAAVRLLYERLKPVRYEFSSDFTLRLLVLDTKSKIQL